MCGITGFTNYNAIDQKNTIKEMLDTLSHRGPDDNGFLISKAITLGHSRLSIIDIEGGHQPMYNEDGSIAFVFNGEIYNFKELKEELIQKGHVFKTNSDSEVIGHLYEDKGVDFPKYLNGMFAIALWDKTRDMLLLTKDRAGKKPLYYGIINNELVFASELKAFTKYPHFKKDINMDAMHKYLAYEYVPTPLSIFKGISKLPAGFILTYKKGDIKTYPYWDYEIKADARLSEKDIINDIDFLLEQSVKRRLISDVPLGVFLSGGIDSSILVYYMSKLMPASQIKTFSIGFKEKSFDESSYAKDVAKAFSTTHHEKILSPNTLIDIIPSVTDFLDEPFADASIIPTYLLAKFTKQHVTVALGGDGGDELFMGYPTFQANKLANIYSIIPKPMHNIIAKLANLMPTSLNNISLDFKIKQFLSSVRENKNFREQLWLGAFSLNEIQKLCPSLNTTNDELFSQTIFYNKKASLLKDIDRLSYLYFKTYLHDDILYKVDRATMAVSLECRAPFLDAVLVDYVATIQDKYKMKGLMTKYILKKLMEDRLPKHILQRPKKGFGIPIAKWFREDLKTLLYDVLSKDRIQREGLFNYSYIESLLKEHMDGKKNHRKKLWTMLMFEMWLEKWHN